MTRGQVFRAALVGTAMVLAGGYAAAQTTPVQPQPTDPNLPSSKNVPPDKIAPRAGDSTGSTGTLSDRLENSNGVIKPPDVGAGGTITPPDTGTTPVIPPPGSPGSSNQNAVPK